ncbi:MAG: alanine racemase [Gammaproteobacteria bacterium]|nr:MAG: alanine racemase [Gammaproteobacteria bacterium]
MARPARARLDAQALHHNLQQVRSHAPTARVLAVVKANGYGHGLAWVANTLKEADGFAVASTEEGMQLRLAGVIKPIMLLEGFFSSDELPALQLRQLAPVLHNEQQLHLLESHPAALPHAVWVKLDTGMHRIGFAPEQLTDVLARLRQLKGIHDIRAMTHFANADDTANAATRTQIELFRSKVNSLGLETSLANSAGIVAWPESHADWVRPGIMLYGGSPLLGKTAEELNLKPVMTLESALIAVHHRRQGEAIGYGGDFVCPEDMPVGVVAIGYGDGYPRHAPAGTPVLVNGSRVPLVGRVSMDMITVDLRAQPKARVGDPVVLWGEGLPVDEVAAKAGTISYEILCHVAERIPRVVMK